MATPAPLSTASGDRAAICSQETELDKVEVFELGEDPGRPFRVLGVVQADFEQTALGRRRALQSHACEVGGQALVQVSERPAFIGGEATSGFAASYPHAGAASGATPGLVAQGVVVVFTGPPTEALPMGPPGVGVATADP